MGNKTWRLLNPERYWAQATIDNHKRRGKIIQATLDELTKLRKSTTVCKYCNKTLLVEFNGKHGNIPQSPSLDRIDVSKPYVNGNIQIICHECNATKGIKSDAELEEYIRLLYKNITKE